MKHCAHVNNTNILDWTGIRTKGTLRRFVHTASIIYSTRDKAHSGKKNKKQIGAAVEEFSRSILIETWKCGSCP